MQDQTAYQEVEPDNEAFEINLKKSTSMPLDSTKKRKTERQTRDDEELLIVRSLATSGKEDNVVKKAAKKLQALQLHLGILFHKLHPSWISVHD